MKLYDTLTISENYLTALYYGDTSGIEDAEELKKVIAMIEYIGPRTIEQVDGSENFTTCDICGLLASTIDINIYER